MKSTVFLFSKVTTENPISMQKLISVRIIKYNTIMNKTTFSESRKKIHLLVCKEIVV